MNGSGHKTSVLVYPHAGECTRGILKWAATGPTITLENGDILLDDPRHHYVPSNVITPFETLLLEKPVKVSLTPTVITSRGYLKESNYPEDIYPPSSYRWLTRLVGEAPRSIYALQDILQSQDYWLTIFDPKSGLVHESHRIRQYERPILEITNWYIQFDNWIEYRSKNSEIMRRDKEKQKEILAVLDGPPPTWPQLALITEGMNIDSLQLGESMRDTLDPLIPTNLPSQERDQIMAYLAWSTNPEVPKSDPVDLVFEWIPVFTYWELLANQLTYMSIGAKGPPALAAVQATVEERITPQLETPVHPALARTFQKILHALEDTKEFFKVRSYWVRELLQLNKQREIITGLPVTREQARNSKDAWFRRFQLIEGRMRMTGIVNHSAIGLVDIIYVGNAHQWPHKHMVFCSRLGRAEEEAAHIQRMIMPPLSAERFLRIRPGGARIGWSCQKYNYNLFNQKKGAWTFQKSGLLRSLTGSKSHGRLLRKYGPKPTEMTRMLSSKECLILNLLQNPQFMLYDFENPDLMDFWGISPEEFKEIANVLVGDGILSVSYMSLFWGLGSIVAIVEGERDSICSTIDGFLQNAPTSSAFLANDGNTGYIMSRFPRHAIDELIQLLPLEAAEYNIRMRCFKPTRNRTYTLDLYTRLRRPDGTWDDDISELLSQARFAS